MSLSLWGEKREGKNKQTKQNIKKKTCKRKGRKKKIERKERSKRKKKEEEEEEKQPTASVKGQRPQECWIGATGNHRRRTHCPEPSFHSNPNSIIGETNFQNPCMQSASEHPAAPWLPTKTVFKFNYLYPSWLNGWRVPAELPNRL